MADKSSARWPALERQRLTHHHRLEEPFFMHLFQVCPSKSLQGQIFIPFARIPLQPLPITQSTQYQERFISDRIHPIDLAVKPND